MFDHFLSQLRFSCNLAVNQILSRIFNFSRPFG